MALTGTGDSLLGDIVKLIIAFFLPPLAVLLEVGLSGHFWISILLTIFFFVPGVIHAMYIVATR
jgi:uncharacterized membrane protein YqaE (UPF0057 family)